MALRGIKVVEMAGLAPAPFAGMVLAGVIHALSYFKTLGQVLPASIKCLHSLSTVWHGDKKVKSLTDLSGKRSVAVNLKKKEGVEVVRRLCREVCGFHTLAHDSETFL